MRKNDHDTRLLIYRSRQISLAFLVIAALITFAVIIVQAQVNGLVWWHLVLPLSALGSAFCLVPKTEEWEYKPWQGKPRKVEQNFDR